MVEFVRKWFKVILSFFANFEAKCAKYDFKIEIFFSKYVFLKSIFASSSGLGSPFSQKNIKISDP